MASASERRAMCCVMSTSATARSRVAWSTAIPRVQTSTTWPGVTRPCCQSKIAQASQRQGQQDGDGRVQQSQPLQIEQAPLSRDYFATDGPVEAAMLAVDPAKRQDDGHVADHVDHLAVNRRGPMRILMVQGLAAGSDAEHGDDNRTCDQAQRRRHRPTDRHEQNDG